MAQRHMWVEFVVGPCPCSEGFSLGSLVFLPPQKGGPWGNKLRVPGFFFFFFFLTLKRVLLLVLI